MEQKRKIVPPVYLLVSLGLMWLLDRYFPVMEWTWPWALMAAPALMVGGLAAILWPFMDFSRVGTGVVPFEEATSLVTGGFYRVTRNPMYLGMVLILLSGGVAFACLSSFLPIPLFIWVIQANFIHGEERFLEEAFGDEYLQYKKRVRRWI